MIQIDEMWEERVKDETYDNYCSNCLVSFVQPERYHIIMFQSENFITFIIILLSLQQGLLIKFMKIQQSYDICIYLE